ncbi:hypothetical protein H072_5902 [Dactylellina haptotyla CBS 200.50]|uniref:Glutathione hydrolase n=1 Tax=Dactylellina haptotyla (strain CBS 200.50) TaxID=1284197 RepID=S8BY71_DACHA|nr:hypothetical protein H072_5902 [Dactylellina haptotyla CBS 200.50]
MSHSRPRPDEEAGAPTPDDETAPLIHNPSTATTTGHKKRGFPTAIAVPKPVSYLASSVLTLFFASIAIYILITGLNAHNLPDKDLQSHLVRATHGAVASDVDICSQIGVSVLKDKNGTAVDAAIATALCIGVIVLYSSGIGGGGFMVVRHANGTSQSVNFREMAPGAAYRDMYNHDPKLAQRGGLAVGIPGEVMGYYTAWQMYGRVPWAELFEPAIRLCEDGFAVTPFLRRTMEIEKEWVMGTNRSQWGFLFTPDGGRMLEEGETMHRPALGRTLRKIAETGPEGFYKGEVARSLARFVRSEGGILTVEDMGKYHVEVNDTLKVWAFGQEILTCPPPCSGPVLIEGLNIAEGLDMSKDESGLATHRIIETMKWISAGRTELGDPRDFNVSNVARVAEIQSKQFAAMVRRNISDTRTYGWKHYNPSYEFKESHGTSHLSVLDAEGMAVALTTTVNLYFGARICDPETGVILNDEMDDFSIPGTGNAFKLQPSIYNYIKPYKRPLSSTAPTITVYNGYPSLIVGASGGSRIVTSVFLAFIKIFKWNYSLLDTVHSPRVHHQLIPEVAYVEHGVRNDVIQGLKERGHEVEELPTIGSVMQAVLRLPDGEIHAVSDFWRKGGVSQKFPL